jgi:hypothetical protein
MGQVPFKYGFFFRKFEIRILGGGRGPKNVKNDPWRLSDFFLSFYSITLIFLGMIVHT